MTQRSRYALMLMLLLTVTMIATSCTSSTPPKAALQDALKKTMEASSYTLSTTLHIEELGLPSGEEQETSMMGLTPANIAAILNGAEIQIVANYQKEPMRTDLNLTATLPSLMNMKLTVPMIITSNQLYVKIADIPLFHLPESVNSKYVQIDLDELVKEQDVSTSGNITQNQKLLQEMTSIWLAGFDEKTYFKEVKASEAAWMEDLPIDQVVTFSIDEGNYPQAVETIVDEILPSLLALLQAGDMNLSSLAIDPARIEQFQTELNDNKDAIKDKLLHDMKVNHLTLTGGIKDDYLVYQQGEVKLQSTDEQSGQQMKLSLTFEGQYTNLDEDIMFDEEVPSDTVTLQQLMDLLQAPTDM